MTAPAPEQLRVLAYELEGSDFRAVREGGAALRAAAGQLEAVQALGERWKREGVLSAYTTELSIALTAGTAPQEPEE